MGILRDYRDGRMDELRSLKYSDTNTKNPYVQKKPGFDYNQINSRLTDVERIAKMLVSKPGLKFQGNLALIQQAENLRQLKNGVQKGLKNGFKDFNLKDTLGQLKDKVVDTLKNNAMATTAIVAQIPVNGTGTHFINNGGSTYLQGGGAEKGTGFGDFLRDSLGAGVGQIDGASSALAGTPVGTQVNGGGLKATTKLFGNEKATTLSRSFETSKDKAADNFSQFTAPAPNFDLGVPANPLKQKASSLSPIGKSILKDNKPLDVPDLTSKAANTYLNTGEVIPGAMKPQTKDNRGHIGYGENNVKSATVYSDDTTVVDQTLYGRISDLAPDYDSQVDKDNVSKLATLEADKSPDFLQLRPLDSTSESDYKDYTKSPLNIHTNFKVADSGISELGKEGAELERIIKEKIDPVNASIAGANYSNDLIPLAFTRLIGNDERTIQFRAFLDDLSDNYTGDWQGTKYVGRAEDFYTYQGFKRDISFSFKIAAMSKPELLPLYNKLNHLVAQTAPSYDGSGSFMRGTLTRIRLGHYLYNLNGFINSVGITWDKLYPWEVDVDKLGLQKLPHILNVSVGFTPIHDFNVVSDIEYPEEKYIGWRGETDGSGKNTRGKTTRRKAGGRLDTAANLNLS